MMSQAEFLDNGEKNPASLIATRPHRSPSSLNNHIFSKIFIIGEKLRLGFHNASMIKDRRHHLRMYCKCFIGSEAVDWLIRHAAIKDRSTATLMFSILKRHNIIHHVCDDHDFKDSVAYFRFRVDDGTLPLSRETELYLKGYQLYHELTSLGASSIMKLHNENGTMFSKSFYGTQLVNWLVKKNKCASRQDAVSLGKDLLELDLIKHVTNDHHFKDERVLYGFHQQLGQLKVIDLLQLDDRPRSLSLDVNMLSNKQRLVSSTLDVPEVLMLTPPTFHVGTPENENNGHRVVSMRSTPDSDSEDPTVTGAQEVYGSPVFKLGPSMAILLDAEKSYFKDTIKIVGDSVGFGFVVRGDGPSYIQTVDPSGPAASAGLKIGHYVYYVNEEYVLNKNHIDVAHIILRNPQQITMDVLMPQERLSPLKTTKSPQKNCGK